MNYPPTYFATSLALAFLLHLLVPVRGLIPSPFHFIGVLFVLAGVAIGVWASKAFVRADTTIKPFERSTKLITHGLYLRTRNPIYLAMVSMLLGVAILLASLGPLLVVPLFPVLIERNFIRREEADLEEAFGGAYLEYKRKVRRWI